MIRFASLLALVLCLAPSCLADQPTELILIQLRADASARGETIRLGDLAELELPKGEEDAQELARLAGISLGQVPSPGSSRRLSQREVRTRLQGAGVADASYRLTGAPSVRIKGAYLTVSARRLQRLAQEAAQEEGLTSTGALATVLPLHLHMSSGALRLSATVLRVRRSEIVVEVVASSEGEESRRRVHLRRAQDTVLAPAIRPRGGRTGARQHAEPRPARRQPVIRAGQRVRLFVREGAIELDMPARARSSGVAGETIQVRVDHTRQELPARVVGPGVVELATDTGGK